MRKIFSQNIIDKIINEFGFRTCNFRNLCFFHSDMFKETIFYVSEQLGKVIEEAKMPLKICLLGSSSFFIDNKDYNTIPIPFYDNLPQAAKYPSKRLISINFNNFEKLVKELSISIDEFSDQDTNSLKSIEQGGIFIKIESCDFIFGSYLHNNFVKLKMSFEKARNMLEKANDLNQFQTVGIGESDFYVDKTELFLRLWWKEG